MVVTLEALKVDASLFHRTCKQYENNT